MHLSGVCFFVIHKQNISKRDRQNCGLKDEDILVATQRCNKCRRSVCFWAVYIC